MKHLIRFCVVFFLSLQPAISAVVDSVSEPKTIYNCAVPTQREDLSAFDWATEGQFIRFYWGYVAGDNQNTVEATNCQWIIDNTLHTGKTIYFVTTAVDMANRESLPSAESTHTIMIKVPKVITAPKPPGSGTFKPYSPVSLVRPQP